MIDLDKAWETAKERPADAIGLAVTPSLSSARP